VEHVDTSVRWSVPLGPVTDKTAIDKAIPAQERVIALARVLVQDPQAILADEPIASLDPERGRELMDLLRDLSRETRKTLVTSIHSIEFGRSHFQRVNGPRRGR